MAGRRRYLCTSCRRQTKWIELNAPDTVRTGCAECQQIQRFAAYHTLAFAALTQRRQVS